MTNSSSELAHPEVAGAEAAGPAQAEAEAGAGAEAEADAAAMAPAPPSPIWLPSRSSSCSRGMWRQSSASTPMSAGLRSRQFHRRTRQSGEAISTSVVSILNASEVADARRRTSSRVAHSASVSQCCGTARTQSIPPLSPQW